MERRNVGSGTADFLNEMMRLPMAAFFYGMEWMYRAMQPPARAVGADPGRMGCGCGRPAAASTGTTSTSGQEGRTIMDDQDLGGDDLKYVSYSILFTKRDYEATLEEEKEELVNYPTDGGSFGGLKIAKFMAKAAQGEAKRPQPWGNKYPEGASGEGPWSIPEEDQRYIRFVYKVERRLNREEAQYDRDQVRELRNINATLGGMSAKIG